MWGHCRLPKNSQEIRGTCMCYVASIMYGTQRTDDGHAAIVLLRFHLITTCYIHQYEKTDGLYTTSTSHEFSIAAASFGQHNTQKTTRQHMY